MLTFAAGFAVGFIVAFCAMLVLALLAIGFAADDEMFDDEHAMFIGGWADNAQHGSVG